MVNKMLLLICQNIKCGRRIKQAYQIEFKGKSLVVCEKCAKELTNEPNSIPL